MLKAHILRSVADQQGCSQPGPGTPRAQLAPQSLPPEFHLLQHQAASPVTSARPPQPATCMSPTQVAQGSPTSTPQTDPPVLTMPAPPATSDSPGKEKVALLYTQPRILGQKSRIWGNHLFSKKATGPGTLVHIQHPHTHMLVPAGHGVHQPA